jgi:DNA-binding IscR family transcriptional regulator
MVPYDDCILGTGASYDRFVATTEILARLVSSAPRAVGMAQLEESTGRRSTELRRLCSGLERAGLLRADGQPAQKWTLGRDPSQVTLEDVYRCVVSEQAPKKKGIRDASQERPSNDVNLFVMQAMIAVNQSVFKHLRQFSLDRLKISAAAMFPKGHRPLRQTSLDDVNETAISGRKAKYGSPLQLSA